MVLIPKNDGKFQDFGSYCRRLVVPSLKHIQQRVRHHRAFPGVTQFQNWYKSLFVKNKATSSQNTRWESIPDYLEKAQGNQALEGGDDTDPPSHFVARDASHVGVAPELVKLGKDFVEHDEDFFLLVHKHNHVHNSLKLIKYKALHKLCLAHSENVYITLLRFGLRIATRLC